jgi:hypothetical protein
MYQSGWACGKLYAMAKASKYVPNVNDSVLVKGKADRYSVVMVRRGKKTADVRTIVGPVILYYDVPWSNLSYLDGGKRA